MGVCKLNGLSAIENRVNEDICGLGGKNHWSLDKTNSIESQGYFKYSVISYSFTIGSFPFAAIYDSRIMAFTYSSWVLGWAFELLSKGCQQKYLEDNDIHDHPRENHKTIKP
jgi:hypothetical protein